MTVEEVFYDLFDKYGDDFNWHMLPSADPSFVAELKMEIGEQHPLYGKPIYAVAKCDSNDDVLFLSSNGQGEDCFYLAHLTYSQYNAPGFPKIDKITGIENLKGHIEHLYVLHYL